MTRKNALEDPEGGARDTQPPLGPNSIIFMQFSAKILPNNSGVGASRSEIS